MIFKSLASSQWNEKIRMIYCCVEAERKIACYWLGHVFWQVKEYFPFRCVEFYTFSTKPWNCVQKQEFWSICVVSRSCIQNLRLVSRALSPKKDQITIRTKCSCPDGGIQNNSLVLLWEWSTYFTLHRGLKMTTYIWINLDYTSIQVSTISEWMTELLCAHMLLLLFSIMRRPIGYYNFVILLLYHACFIVYIQIIGFSSQFWRRMAFYVKSMKGGKVRKWPRLPFIFVKYFQYAFL